MKTINCPNSWADVKLENYLNFYKQIKPYIGTEEYGEKAIINGIFSFTNISDEDYLDLPQDEYIKLEEQVFKLLSVTEKMPIIKSFEADKTKYGFIPALDEMTYGEYLDLVTYSKKDMWNNIPLLMSILYRPITKELSKSYKIEKYNGANEEQIEFFKHTLTMDVVFGALSFFLRLQNDLLIGTQTYLQEMLKGKTSEKSQVQKVLAQSGVSTTQLQSLQEMISSNLTTLRSFQSTNA
jgi:hypothetical protein